MGSAGLYRLLCSGLPSACHIVAAQQGAKVHRETRDITRQGAKLVNSVIAKGSYEGADFRGADLTGATEIGGQDPVSGSWKGAFYDSATKLPFSRDEALQRGMVEETAGSATKPVIPTSENCEVNEF
jgi:hypothetical protein